MLTGEGYRRALRNSVGAEARAYGFSVVLLATGYLAVRYHGLPGVGGAFAYVGGVLAAQAVAAAVAFRRPGATWSSGERTEYRAPGAVHLASPVAATLVGWGVSATPAPHAGAFAASGFAAILAYQLVLAAELALAIVDG